MKKPFLIAEVAQGYEGSKKLVELYANAAIQCGVDAIKFQIFYADELACPDYEYYELFKSLEIDYDFWAKVIKKLQKNGIKFYSDIFGEQSLEKLSKIGIDGYKIHTTDIDNEFLIRKIAMQGKHILLSTGGCSFDQISMALKWIEGKSPVTLMCGFQAEPTLIQDNNLLRIKSLKEAFKTTVGFQDHIKGDDPLSMYLPFIALGCGADVIEKHLTLSRNANIEDDISALIPDEFKDLNIKLKKAWKALGRETLNPTAKEAFYRNKVKRVAVARKDLKKGTCIIRQDILLKRSSQEGVTVDEVLGKLINKNISKNAIIKKGTLK